MSDNRVLPQITVSVPLSKTICEGTFNYIDIDVFRFLHEPCMNFVRVEMENQGAFEYIDEFALPEPDIAYLTDIITTTDLINVANQWIEEHVIVNPNT